MLGFTEPVTRTDFAAISEEGNVETAKLFCIAEPQGRGCSVCFETSLRCSVFQDGLLLSFRPNMHRDCPYLGCSVTCLGGNLTARVSTHSNWPSLTHTSAAVTHHGLLCTGGCVCLERQDVLLHSSRVARDKKAPGWLFRAIPPSPKCLELALRGAV